MNCEQPNNIKQPWWLRTSHLTTYVEREKGRQRDIDYSQQHLLENHSISSSSTLSVQTWFLWRCPSVVSSAARLRRRVVARSALPSPHRGRPQSPLNTQGLPAFKTRGKKSSWEIKAGIGVEFCFPDLSARVSYLYLPTFWNRSSLEAPSPLWNGGLTCPSWSSYAQPGAMAPEILLPLQF